jgi:hypothetical protein
MEGLRSGVDDKENLLESREDLGLKASDFPADDVKNQDMQTDAWHI